MFTLIGRCEDRNTRTLHPTSTSAKTKLGSSIHNFHNHSNILSSAAKAKDDNCNNDKVTNGLSHKTLNRNKANNSESISRSYQELAALVTILLVVVILLPNNAEAHEP